MLVCVLWDVRARRALARLTGDNSVTACAIGGDGRTVVAGDQRGAVHVLRLEPPTA